MMQSRRWLSIVSFGIAVALRPGSLPAQTCQATAPSSAPTCNVPLNAVATVGHLLQLTVSGGSQTNLASPLVTTYDSSASATTAGQNDAQPFGANGPSVSVKANRGWQLNIMAGQSYWTFAADATYQLCRPGGGTYATGCTGSSTSTAGKAAGDLLWSLSSSTGFNSLLATSGQNFAANPTGSSQSYSIYYRVKWAYASDVPGTYTLPVVFTLTGQ